MEPTSSTSGERALNAFLRRYLLDRSVGKPRSLAEYQADWPEHASMIGAWWESHADGGNDTGTPPSPPPMAERIGSYRVLKELGRGGQGVVYLAEDERLRRRVAIKVLTGLGTVTSDRIARFLREATVASRLSNPGIAAVYEIGVDAGTPFIAMQYVEGEPLAASIGGKRDVARSVSIAEKAARALHVAHEAGIVHRDVKPGNILVTTGGDPVILDFGLAHDADPELATITRSDEFFGTPAYMSPEQIAAHLPRADRRTDVWSLGATLYECLAGTRPFDAPTREQLYRAILSTEPADLRRANPAVSPDLAAIVETALEKSPDRRYRTAAAMADDLLALQEGRPVAARRIGAAGRLVRWARREPAKAALVALILITLPTIAAFVAGWFANKDRLAAARALALREEKDELVAQGFYQAGEGDPDTAIEFFERAVALDGGSPEAVLGIAVVRLRRHAPDAALQALDAHAQMVEGLRQAGVIRAAAAFALGRTLPVGGSESRPNANGDPIDDYLEAERLLDLGHAGRAGAYAEAMKKSRSAIYRSLVPRSAYFQCAAHAASHVGDRDAAREMADALRRHWPRSAACARWAGLALRIVSMEDAIALLRKALELKPDYIDGQLSLGDVLREAGRPDEAIAALREAIRLKPDYAIAHLALGSTLRDRGRPDEALAAFRDAIRYKPTYADAHSNVGLMLKEQGKLDEALVSFAEALRLDPTSAQTHNNLGSTLRARGQLGEAIKSYRAALRFNPGHPDAQNNLATALLEANQNEEAITAARASIDHDPARAETWFLLGNGLMAVGRFEEAIGPFREALRLDPNYAEAQCNLSRPLIELGQLAAGLDAVRRGHELGSRRPDWPYASAAWVANAEQLVAAEQRMLAIAAGRDEADGTADLLQLAELASRTRRWDLAVTWYGAAFDADPDLARPKQAWVLKASRAAIRVAFPPCDASRPSNETMRSQVRGQALSWLERALASHRRIAAARGPGLDESRTAVAAWLEEPALAPVRDEAWIAALSPDEAKAWSALWAGAREAAEAR